MIPELKLDTEYVLLAPKGTPAEIVEAMNAAILDVTATDDWKQMVNDYCFQNPFVLNVEETLADLKEQRDLFQSFVPSCDSRPSNKQQGPRQSGAPPV